MRKIQDNEFDQFFKNKFEEAEITPSKNLWDTIETQLAVKPKRVFPVYRIAAVLAVAALSIALLTYTGQHAGENKTGRSAGPGRRSAAEPGPVIVSSSSGKAEAASGKAEAFGKADVPSGKPEAESGNKPQAAWASESKAAIRSQAGLLPVTTSARINKLVPRSSAQAIQLVRQEDDLKKDLKGMQPLAINTRLQKNDLAVKQQKLPLPNAANEVSVLANMDNNRSAPDAESPAGGDIVINDNENKTENKGIRNMGDLINYVVDKVDKSDEKIIQFKTDDDNSSLVALNIGIIRFNTKKHK
jgi:hypothetical protein